MKKIICISFISFLLSSTKLFSQSIDLPADSVTTLLCKKWEVNYALIGNMKISSIPGATEIIYEFNKDKTFLMTSNDAKDKTKGDWSYDEERKIIKLNINGKNSTSIISLKEGEFVMLADTKEATPDDPMAIKLVYKIKTK
jgi:hypothetical protein